MLQPRQIIPELILLIGILSFLSAGINSNMPLLLGFPVSLLFYWFQDRERRKDITNSQIEELTSAVKKYTDGTNETLKKALLELDEVKSITSKNSLAIGMARK